MLNSANLGRPSNSILFGVEVFFVISGLLITHLLLEEYERRDGVDLGRFYMRRTLRIVPAYAAFLVAVAVIRWHGYGPQIRWWPLLTYTQNYLGTVWFPIGHTWSLCVEEQFYLLWPLAFVLTAGLQSKRLRHLPLLLLLLPVLLCPVCRVVAYRDDYSQPFLHFSSFFLHADSLAIGCLAAVALRRCGTQIEHVVTTRLASVCLIAIVLNAIPHVLTSLLVAGELTIPFGRTLRGIGVAILLVASVIRPDAACFRWLRWRWLAGIGVLSYSLYLWQQLFCAPASSYGISDAPWYLSFPTWLLPAFAAAIVSHVCIEAPFLRLKSRFQTERSERSEAELKVAGPEASASV